MSIWDLVIPPLDRSFKYQISVVFFPMNTYVAMCVDGSMMRPGGAVYTDVFLARWDDRTPWGGENPGVAI